MKIERWEGKGEEWKDDDDGKRTMEGSEKMRERTRKEVRKEKTKSERVSE